MTSDDDEKGPIRLPKGAIRRYTMCGVRYALRYKTLLGASGLIVVFGALFALLEPWPLQFLVDDVLTRHRRPLHLTGPLALLAPIAGNRLALLLVAVAAGFVFVLIVQVMHVLDSYVHTKLEYRMVFDFRGDLFLHLQRMSLAYHDRKRAGELMSRVNQSSYSIGFLPTTVPGLVQSLISLVGMAWIAFLLDARLALLALIVVPLLFFTTRYYSRNVMPQVLAARRLEGQSMAIIHEAVSMIRIMLAYVREEYEYKRFHDQGERMIAARLTVTVKQTLFSLAVSVITAAGIALVTGYGAYHVMQGQLTIGKLLVIMMYIREMYGPLENISNATTHIQENYVGVHRCYELLDQEPDVVDAPNAVALTETRGNIAFENVSFRYDDRHTTLENISFAVGSGEAVAIVGPTGAGKSTLMNLVTRFYDPATGRILLDGRDIREVTVKSLRSHISVVLQEPLLFSGTIAENILYGRLDASREDMVEAAKGANAHDFITRLPQGYRTRLGERGARLSGGERQRVCIARAFLKNAPILILDEPTSSIDSRTEEIILEALDRLMQGRTTFIIAHRLSTIRSVDRILVLDHGRLVEEGTHEALLGKGGLYRQLHDVQSERARRRRDGRLSVVAPDAREQPA